LERFVAFLRPHGRFFWAIPGALFRFDAPSLSDF